MVPQRHTEGVSSKIKSERNADFPFREFASKAKSQPKRLDFKDNSQDKAAKNHQR